jgi:hypothetical protein
MGHGDSHFHPFGAGLTCVFGRKKDARPIEEQTSEFTVMYATAYCKERNLSP